MKNECILVFEFWMFLGACAFYCSNGFHGVVKIFGHERKPGEDEQIGVVQQVHMYARNGDRKVCVGSGPML